MVTLLVYRISGGLATLSGLAIGEVATAPTLRISKQTMPHAANHIPPVTVGCWREYVVAATEGQLLAIELAPCYTRIASIDCENAHHFRWQGQMSWVWHVLGSSTGHWQMQIASSSLRAPLIGLRSAELLKWLLCVCNQPCNQRQQR